ncbi:MAG: hypothetical protein Q7V63_08930 [Gammaproteobacteria bacterium]|nr:hypothetical protein [Gammaproteobacteria bacterium]
MLAEISDDRKYVETWGNVSNLEQVLLALIAEGNSNLLSGAAKFALAKQLGIPKIETPPAIQSAIRTLIRNNYEQVKPG